MSDLKHRTLPELKSFAKKYKEHFKLNVSKIKKVELLKRIDNGMLKAINPALQKGLKEEYEKLKQPKEKKPKVIKKKIEKKVIKKIKIQESKEKKPKVIKKIKIQESTEQVKKRVHKKVEKPKVKPSKSKLLQVKGVGSVPPPKIKPPMATMKITPKPKGKVKQAVAKIEKKTKPSPKKESKFPFKITTKKIDPKKKKRDDLIDVLEGDLNELVQEVSFIVDNIRDSEEYDINKSNSFLESDIFKDSDYKNFNELKSEFLNLQKKSKEYNNNNILDDVENIKDRLPFIKDNMKISKSKSKK